jgi:hypothetical protein
VICNGFGLESVRDLRVTACCFGFTRQCSVLSMGCIEHPAPAPSTQHPPSSIIPSPGSGVSHRLCAVAAYGRVDSGQGNRGGWGMGLPWLLVVGCWFIVYGPRVDAVVGSILVTTEQSPSKSVWSWSWSKKCLGWHKSRSFGFGC